MRSGHVFKASYNGETVAAKEMDLGKSAAVQEAFINVCGLRRRWHLRVCMRGRGVVDGVCRRG